MMNANYSYPLDPSWSVKEVETVISMFWVVEDAYEVGIPAPKILEVYQAFKKVIPAKSEEKRLSKAFARVSGYELYEVVKVATQKQSGQVKLGVE